MKFLTHSFKDKGKVSKTPVPGPIIDANCMEDAQAKAEMKGLLVNGKDEWGFVFSGLLPA